MPVEEEKVSEIFPVGAEAEKTVPPDKPPEISEAGIQAVGEDSASPKAGADGGNVVDMRTGKEPLDEVATNADTLTTLADDEEGEFIIGVEKAHKKS